MTTTDQHPTVEGRDIRLHTLFVGMMEELPRVGGDEPSPTPQQLNQWLADFGVVLRRIYQIREQP